MNSEFTKTELEFLREAGIYHVKFHRGQPVGIIEFMYSFGLVTGYETHKHGARFYHRFCYPKSKFDVVDVYNFALDWDTHQLPPAGWVKYKGQPGEFSNGESDRVKVLECLLTSGTSDF